MGDKNAKQNSRATSHRGQTEEKGPNHYVTWFLCLTQEVEPQKAKENECVLGLLSYLVDDTVRNHVKVGSHFRHCSVTEIVVAQVVNQKHVAVAHKLLLDYRDHRVEWKQVGEHGVEGMIYFVFIAELLHMAELQGVKHFKVDKNLLERPFELQDL